MIYLLDTHTFIGLDINPGLLSQKVRDICEEPSNTLYVSFASVWEMQIKLSLGKLSLPRPLPETINWQQTENDVQILPVTLPHVFALDGLPHLHRDPFDRIIIAQAKVENMTILSKDSVFAQYPVTVIW